ncbi:fibronectin type III domain-containing protein [Candidatus Poriferisodalis sp.]|uniref:fibronectin type III domain-containing protein n=1 Tax=Candidatus Poriferisodalis sp. TaxID=3101277 RepID=UPI003B02C78E
MRAKRVRAVVCVVLAGGLLWSAAGPVSAQGEGSGDGVVLAVANESSLSDIGVGAMLVASGEADALVLSSGADALGEDAQRVVERAVFGGVEGGVSGVILVGGAAVLSETLRWQVMSLASGATVERLSGATRIETAAAAARRALGSPGEAGEVEIALANGWSLADVGAAAGLVAAGGADAVLYTDRDVLAGGAESLLSDYWVSRLFVVGGTAAVSAGLRADAVAAAGAEVRSRRLAGAAREHTAAEVANAAAGECVAAAVIANGHSPVDVGTAAALAAALGDSVVLYAASPHDAGQPAHYAVVDLAPQQIILIGSTDALSDTVKTQLPGGRTATRISSTHQAAQHALQGPSNSCNTEDDVFDRSGLTLAGADKRADIHVSWQLIDPFIAGELGGIRIEWRAGNQEYDSTRRRVVPSTMQQHTISGLEYGAEYHVRASAMISDDVAIAVLEGTARTLSYKSWIEKNVIDPRVAANPWLREAWYEYPLPARIHAVAHPEYKHGAGLYFSVPPAISMRHDYRHAHNVILHELGHHYSLHPHIHSDDPQRKLGIAALWLYMLERRTVTNDSYSHGEAVADYLASYTVHGCDKLPRSGRYPEFGREAACAFMTSLSNGEMPQWFLDRYTSHGTMRSIDLDELWADLKLLRLDGGIWQIVEHLKHLFGGYCSHEEGRGAMWVTALKHRGPPPKNPWVDGGCKNRVPQDVQAGPGGAGAIEVSWAGPLYQTTPDINAYTVQWKTAGQNYDTTRQAILTVPLHYFGTTSHTISGLSPGVSYSIRITAVNSSNPTRDTDSDRRRRTAETTATAG